MIFLISISKLIGNRDRYFIFFCSLNKDNLSYLFQEDDPEEKKKNPNEVYSANIKWSWVQFIETLIYHLVSQY